MTAYSYVNVTASQMVIGSVTLSPNQSVTYNETQPILDAAIQQGIDRFVDGVKDNNPYNDPAPFPVVVSDETGVKGLLIGDVLYPLPGMPKNFTSRALDATDNRAVLSCATVQVVTINNGLPKGFQVNIRGHFTYDGTASVVDEREGNKNPPHHYATLVNIGIDQYALVGLKQ